MCHREYANAHSHRTRITTETGLNTIRAKTMTDQKKINAMPEILAALIRIEAHAIVNRQANARILSILKETERDEEFAAMVKLYDEIRQQLSENLESRAL
jgi:hypothetical protein